MTSFDEWWEENYMMLSADRTEAEDIYNIGSQSRQAEIDELRAYITKAQGCLPYYLLDIKSKDNWIGGVQSYIVELEVKIEESILKLEAINSSMWEESIEDVLSILKENQS